MGYYDQYDRWVPGDRKAPAVRGEVEASLPKDMNVLPGSKQRVGYEQRQKTAHRLSVAYGDGYLTDEEHTARYEYVMNEAKSTYDLNELVRDLPAPRDRRTVRQKVHDDFSMSKPRWYVPIHMLVAAGFLWVAIAPSVIAAHDHWWTTTHGYATIITLMIIGAVGVVANVCMAIGRAVNGK